MKTFLTSYLIVAAMGGMLLAKPTAATRQRRGERASSAAEPPQASRMLMLMPERTEDDKIGNMCDTGLNPFASPGNYCSMHTVGECTTDLLTGTCQAKPFMCMFNYSPVCACGGRKTYSNECAANADGANVWHEGKCGKRN